MKNIVTIGLLLIGLGIAGTIATASFTDVFSFKADNYLDQKEVNAEGIQNIEVAASSTDIRVIPSKTDEIKIELAGKVSKRIKENFKLIVEEEGNTLKVGMEDKTFINFGVIIMSLDLVVQVPEKEYESMILTTSSGDIKIKDVQAKEMKTEVSSGDINVEGVTVASTYKLKASSGDILVKDVKAEAFDLRANSGDIILENLDGDVTVETSSGDIEIDNKKVMGNILAEASSGDVNVTFLEEPNSLSIDFKGSSGDGTVNLEGVSYEEKSDDTIIGKIGKGEFELKVRTTSGDFKLK